MSVLEEQVYQQGLIISELIRRFESLQRALAPPTGGGAGGGGSVVSGGGGISSVVERLHVTQRLKIPVGTDKYD